MQIGDMVDAFVEGWPDSEYGPAHIVLSDYNLNDVHIQWCQRLIVAIRTRQAEPEDLPLLNTVNWWAGHSHEELEATYNFLGQLLAIPERIRTI